MPRGSCAPLLFSRPFLDMVYHALDSPDDDYHALFVLCLLYAMSHNKGKPPRLACLRGIPLCLVEPKKKAAFLEECPFWFWQTPTKLLFTLLEFLRCFCADQSHRNWLLRQYGWGGREGASDCLTQHDSIHAVVCFRPLAFTTGLVSDLSF